VRAYYEALQRDPDFAEAWFNLGVLDERDGRMAAANAHYRAAAFAQPNFADALFNLALLLTQGENYDEAAALWDRFLAQEPRGPDADRARKGAALCRLARDDGARRNAG
jgi:tetratricopeptide (TPR) repeat protein